MPHIVFAIFVVTVAFVHLVKGQTCASAQDNLDFRCVTELLNTADPSVCSGSCDSELAALRTACRNSGDPNAEQVVSAYETACLSGPECTAALNALNGNPDCVNAFNAEDDFNTTVLCTGSCSNLAAAAFNICPNNPFVSSSRRDYNRACGFESGSTRLLQASGIVILLLVALCKLTV